jgi:hypothetical protein
MGQRAVRLVGVNTQAYSEVVVTAQRIAAPMASGASIEPGELTIRAGATASSNSRPARDRAGPEENAVYFE